MSAYGTRGELAARPAVGSGRHFVLHVGEMLLATVAVMLLHHSEYSPPAPALLSASRDRPARRPSRSDGG